MRHDEESMRNRSVLLSRCSRPCPLDGHTTNSCFSIKELQTKETLPTANHSIIGSIVVPHHKVQLPQQQQSDTAPCMEQSLVGH